jgi:hypothetical protein
MGPIEAGFFCLIVGCIAGYLFHGWEFDGKLAKLERQYDEFEARQRAAAGAIDSGEGA